MLDPKDVDALLALDLPEPMIGEDISNPEGEVLVSDVELLWPEQQVALLLDEPETSLLGWVLINTSHKGWLEELNAALVAATV